MTVKSAGILETAKIYKEHLVFDFPKSEHKLLILIIIAMVKRKYLCRKLYDGNEFVAYALFVKRKRDYLLDYFAVLPDKRDNGYGSKFIKILKEDFKDRGTVLIEVEAIEDAKNQEETDIRTKRMSFYLRNGCVDTKLQVSAFGVKFNLLTLDKVKYNDEKLKQTYIDLYRVVLPKGLMKYIKA